MERTQIYLTRRQAAALDSEAKRTGTTRSHLIREAIEQRYVTGPDRARVDRALRASAGLWQGRRVSGEQYVERLRTGRRLADLHAKAKPDATA